MTRVNAQSLPRLQIPDNEFAGKLEKAREFYRRSIELAQRQHLGEPAGLTAAFEALTEAEFGNAGRARQRAREALGMAENASERRFLAGRLEECERHG